MNTITLETARLTNETDITIDVGDFVVLNSGSRQILAVAKTEAEIAVLAREIEDCNDIEIEEARVV